jgi:hypothetical protein
MITPHAIDAGERSEHTTAIFTRNRCLGVLAVLSAAYCVLTLVPGRFAVTDEVFFKAAGRNWAQTGRFAAPELVGRLSEGPSLADVYFAQPPLYTFLFGVYVKLAGFSARSCIAYDLLIHMLLIWTAMAFARIVYGLAWGWAALCGALLLTLGTAGRPDELGIVFALWAAPAFRSRLSEQVRIPVGGVALGLCLCTSLGAFLFLSPVLVWELLETQRDFRRRISVFAVAALLCAITAAVCVSPILIAHPTAYRQMIEHAGEQSAVLSAVTGEARNSTLGLIGYWATMIRYGSSYAMLVGGLLLFAALCRLLDRSDDPAYRHIFILFVSLAAMELVMPGKYPYLWFQGCWLLIACVELAARISDSTSALPRRLLLAFGCCIWLAASLPAIRWAGIMWSIPAGQSLTNSTRRLLEEIPAGAGVMTTDYWWDLGNRDRVYDLVFSDPGASAVDYVVLSGNGSGKPGVPTDFRAKYKTGFAPVYDDLNREPTRVLSQAISRSSYGFGAYVLKNTKSTRH